MNKITNWVLAAILICGTSVFTACRDNNDNPIDPSIDNLAEKVLGKWISVEEGGVLHCTNKKGVVTFGENGKGLFSSAFGDLGWHHNTPFDYIVTDNTLAWSVQESPFMQINIKHTVTDITNKEMKTVTELKFNAGGQIVNTVGPVPMRYERVTVDYTTDILGVWEGKVTSETSEFDDGEMHHWEYRADGTYVYYSQDENGNWTSNPDQTVSDYFIDGPLLCTHWVIDGQEYSEWWEVESIKDGVMKWTALREKEDGTTYTASFEMKKVEMPAPAKKIDLATLTADYTAQDGDILTGKLAEAVKITIADSASITIADAYINDEWAEYNGKDFAGITCLGDATITICGSNSISGFHTYYPAIFVADGHTLTFQGDGILSARSNGYYSCLSAAIGSIRGGANCGKLVFLGGEIYAEGGNMSAAIGASDASDCGDITIGGTAEIYISSPKGAAAIGSGSGVYPDFSDCGDITICGSARIEVTGGSNSAAIGAGTFGTCGNITIGEEARVSANGIKCGPGIGAGHFGTCKAIIIEGGFIKATCDDYGPGIGTFYGNKSKCESITITGGTVIATGGEDAPAIGSGPENPYAIPITITSGIRAITANRGSALADYIGTGVDGTRGSVTIDGVENATPESTFPNLELSVEGNTWTLYPKDREID